MVWVLRRTLLSNNRMNIVLPWHVVCVSALRKAGKMLASRVAHFLYPTIWRTFEIRVYCQCVNVRKVIPSREGILEPPISANYIIVTIKNN